MQTQDLDQLREMFLNAPESAAVQTVARIVSFTLLVTVLWMVRRRTLREEYTPIWIAVAVAMALVSLRLDVLNSVTRLIGAWTPSSTILFLGELFLVVLCLNYATRLSRHGTRLKNLGQENALLRARIDQLAQRLEADS